MPNGMLAAGPLRPPLDRMWSVRHKRCSARGPGREETMAEKQTAGRDRLGDIAPEFAHLNDDVLFGEVWSREEELSARDRSLITIAALFSAGLYPQLKSHLALGRQHGITKQEAIEAVTQLAFYCGRPKAWSTFPMIEEVWGEE